MTTPVAEPDLETQSCRSARSDMAAYSFVAHARLWGLAVTGLAADLWTKDLAFTRLRRSRHIIPDVLSFQRSENSGALFGLDQNMTALFVVASFIALLFVLYIFIRSARTQRSFHFGLGMVLAGALGNLHDRIFREGRVRDFIKIELRIGEMELWPWVFNVADMLLVCGVAILMINIWFDRKSLRNSECEQSVTTA